MDLARRVYGRELKITAMRDIDTRRAVARQVGAEPDVVGALARRVADERHCPSNGRPGPSPFGSEQQQITEEKRKIGQLTESKESEFQLALKKRDPIVKRPVGARRRWRQK